MKEPVPDAAADALDGRVDAMSLRVNQDRDRRCAQLRVAVEAQARDILRAARKEARAKVHAAVVVERRLAAQALRQAAASAWLERQQVSHQQSNAVVEHLWSALPGALEARWADPARRTSWIDAAIRQARTLLSDPAWRIAHGAGWPAQELEQMRALARGSDAASAARVIELVCEPTIRAGIRIGVKGASLDATTEGLLTSRTQIESKFLAQYLALAPAPAPAPAPAHGAA